VAFYKFELNFKMKRNRPFIYLLIFLGFGVMLISACKKGDTSAPVLTLNGDPVVYLSLNQQYNKTIDAGATAYDDHDLDNLYVYSNLWYDNPNVKKTGVYTIDYWAIDGAGNKGTTYRTVIVRNDAEFLAGTFNVADTSGGVPFAYTQIITADQTINNRIHFSKFGNYDNNVNIYATVTLDKDSIYIPVQTANNIGSSLENHKFSGTGVINGQNLIINYTDINTTASSSTDCVAHYIKQ
jgi:hypothetical protein